MPLPKNYNKKLYKTVVSAQQARGVPRAKAKEMADEAVTDEARGKGKAKGKGRKKK